VWDSSKGRTHIQHYQLSDNFRTVYLKDGVYCIRQRIKGQTVYPQPSPMEIVIMHHYQTVLESNNNFKKHVSWFTSATDQSMSRIALYEYLGTYDLRSTDIVITNPKVIQQIKEDHRHRKPKEIFLQMNLNNSVEAPKDTRQIKNAKSREKKKTTQPRNNIADEILAVLSMMNEHPFVQQVIHKKGQVPSIIFKQKIKWLILRISCQDKVGVDRTFNLGHFFVTTLVYKNHRVVKDTKDPPIFIGPLLLHKDASYRTYYSFFTYIATEI
jgi:hypothetical protein